MIAHEHCTPGRAVWFTPDRDGYVEYRAATGKIPAVIQSCGAVRVTIVFNDPSGRRSDRRINVGRARLEVA